MSKCLNEREGERNMEENEKKSPQESRNERIRDFLQENFFQRFPQGRAALSESVEGAVERYTYGSILICCQVQYIKAT